MRKRETVNQEVTSMPLGYIHNKWFRVNYDYDRYAETEAWRKLVSYAGRCGFYVFLDYSHIGRNFQAEIKKQHKYVPGDAVYVISVALKSGATPMIALTAALEAAFEKEANHPDLLMRVLMMEVEAQSLVFAIQDARAREKKRADLEARLESQLDGLFEVLALAWGYQTRAEMTLLIANPSITIQSKSLPGVGTLPADPDEDDDL